MGGCHLTLPGGVRLNKQWCAERRINRVSTTRKGHTSAVDDAVVKYMQPIPLRCGEMVIWSWGQLHGSTRSRSHAMRLMQFIHMYPAPETGRIFWDHHDAFACTISLRSCFKKGHLSQDDIIQMGLGTLGLRLLGLETWESSASGVEVD